MKRIKLTERDLTRIIKRVINEQEYTFDDETVELNSKDAGKSASNIVDGYAYSRDFRVTDKEQLDELYYMYKHMLMDAVNKGGGKIREGDYDNAVYISKTEHGNTSPVIPYESLKELAKYV